MNHNTNAYPEGFALVIGGSGGVGTAICKELVESQVPLLLTYNSNQTQAEALVSELQAVSNDVACCQVSL
jgi:3-oxoacyl-[acyl-carrier protein] reductase